MCNKFFNILMTSKNSVNIRLVKNSLDKIQEFEKAEWIIADQEHYGKQVDFAKKSYKFVAYINDSKIAGTLDLTIEVNLAFIESVLVGSKFQKKGIGKQLVEKAENFAKENGCTKIYLETNEGWGAEEFYRRIGYEVTGVHEKHILGQKTLIFTKFL